MKTAQQLLTASAFTCLASSSAVFSHEASQNRNLDVWRRATPQAPNGYAPAAVDCPSTRPNVRFANGLSDSETSWLEKRRSNVIDPMRELLVRLNISGFDAGQYVDNNRDNATSLPNIGIAFSGGGYRAMLNGAGGLAAFDSRTPNSTNSGQIGGLLQAATYIAGLSGGSWLVGSIYTNNFTSVQAIIDQNNDGDVWQLGNSILKGPKTGGIQLLSTVEYYNNLYDSVKSKVDASGDFNASLTDYWGRALSYQLVNASEGGPGFTWSSVQDDPDFQNANAPFPIILADERAPGETIVALNTTNIEFNPFEMGSFDPTLYGFVPLKYLGSNFKGGSLPSSESCIAGFDNAGFVMGTSSSLFNQAILQLNTFSGVPDIVKNAIQGVLTDLGNDHDDIADYTPNPFYHFNNRTNPSALTERLTLVDGGEDGQNIPLNPLIQPVRAVDVIFAVDSSADTADPRKSAFNWPNGTSLVATYQRSTNASMQNGTSFPYIPDQNTFVNLGLNNRPTFFGCDAGNLTGPAPLIVYLPNSPYVYNSNVSTYQMEYNNTERNAIIENGYDVVTQGNGTRDADWPTCVGCAILSRSFNRTGTDVPDACQQCFTKYCWNGTVDSSEPASYYPEMILTAIKVTSGAGVFTPNVIGFALAAAVSGFLMM
ncbi:lysophospholipase catalytic domain-containing protein [Lophiotrema nucula]|uniref:Lysophospholipase n=1 Tax=Lophiotrema nucula TaxID=690887 RepID=A0A6A5ZCK4_9PLEO|nr:lysophospholipase catalytic domain-containing protein [Lophiotrema nucula]